MLQHGNDWISARVHRMQSNRSTICAISPLRFLNFTFRLPIIVFPKLKRLEAISPIKISFAILKRQLFQMSQIQWLQGLWFDKVSITTLDSCLCHQGSNLAKVFICYVFDESFKRYNLYYFFWCFVENKVDFDMWKNDLF